MGIKQVQISVNDVAVGMFVSKLDRPWCDTPFPIQGFYIRSDDEIKSLQKYCQNVYIDLARETSFSPAIQHYVVKGATSPKKVGMQNVSKNTARKPQSGKSDTELKLPPIVIKNRQTYVTKTSLKKETKKAEKS